MSRSALPVGVLGALAFFLTLRSFCAAYDHGYDIWFAGRVIAVNSRAGLIRIARGPTETRDAAVIDCSITRRALHRIYRGMQVEVEADTRSEPWRIIRLRPLEYRIRPILHTFSFI